MGKTERTNQRRENETTTRFKTAVFFFLNCLITYCTEQQNNNNKQPFSNHKRVEGVASVCPPSVAIKGRVIREDIRNEGSVNASVKHRNDSVDNDTDV